MNESFAVQSGAVSLRPGAARPAPAPAVPAVDEPRVLQVLAEIADDSRRCPDTYLRDTVVPHGGE
jgi:hypothetical protein